MKFGHTLTNRDVTFRWSLDKYFPVMRANQRIILAFRAVFFVGLPVGFICSC